MVARLILIFLFSYSQLAGAQISVKKEIEEKDIEVAIGIDEIVKLGFDFSQGGVSIGNESLLQLTLALQKKEITFRGIKPGKTSVTVRDTLGNVRLKYIVVITSSGKSNTVQEIRELIGDVEGLEIGIKGGKVYVGGEIVVPADIGRVSIVLQGYPDVLRLFELSPQTQRIIARKMMDELAKNNLKDVTVRVVNKSFWLEGVVSSQGKKDLAEKIAESYLPDKISSLSQSSDRLQAIQGKSPIISFIGINAKKDPPPPPKQIEITSQFVELTKDYSKVFAFKWAPLMGEDQSQISIGQTTGSDGSAGAVTTSSSGTLSATISNLFPKLNSAKQAGYARVVQSGMVVTKDSVAARISKQTSIPFAVGSGDFTRADNQSIGYSMDVTPTIIDGEKIELAIGVNVSIPSNVGNNATTSNNISTTVVVKSKESAAIGGVVQNASSTNFDRDDPAPLSDTTVTPLFRIIRSKNYTQSKNQYAIFVTPKIIDSASEGSEELRKKFRRRRRIR